ncbi:MAG: hypothetical protein ACR2N4_06490 [Jatrophihabitans sp.]
MAVTVEYVQAGGYTAAQDRQARAALFARSSPGQVRPGILLSDGSDLAVTALVTPNGTVNVNKGQVVIPDAAGGAYVLTLDALQNTDILTTHPASATNPRIDLVIARVYDNEPGDGVATTPLALAGGGTANVQTFTGKVEMVTGIAAPSGTQVPPALPNGRCVVLKQVTVRAGTTTITAADVADVAPGQAASTGRVGFTAAAGAPIPVRNQAERDALTPYTSLMVNRLDLGWQETYNGTGWVVPNPNDTFGGSPLVGAAYDPTKPIKHFIARKVGNSDANGFSAASPMPAGAVSILGATLGMGQVTGHTILFRTDASTVASAVFQLRSSTTPFGQLTGTAYDFTHDIAYQ